MFTVFATYYIKINKRLEVNGKILTFPGPGVLGNDAIFRTAGKTCCSA